MHARVASWEGGNPDAIRRSSDEIRERAGEGPPEGVPAVGFLLLVDPENGRSMAISLFESEDDLRQGDEVLNGMSPPDDGMGTRSSVQVYEVAVDVRL